VVGSTYVADEVCDGLRKRLERVFRDLGEGSNLEFISWAYRYLYPVPTFRNTEADEAVWDVASRNFTPTAPVTNKIQEAADVIGLVDDDHKSDLILSSSEDLHGQYTGKFDRALSGRYKLRLYETLTSKQASILTQARTGHWCLDQYLSRIGVVGDAKSRCGIDDETVRHILCVCPLSAVQRKMLPPPVGRHAEHFR